MRITITGTPAGTLVRSLLLVALSGGAASLVGQGAAPPPASVPFQLTRMALDLRVDYDSATIAGTAALTLRNASARPVDAVPLLLGRLLVVSDVRDGAGRALPFRQRFALFTDEPARQVNAITVRAPHAVAPGDSITIAVRYAGTLVGYAETGSLYIRDHVDSAFTILREDAYAFPVAGVLSARADHAAPRGLFAFTARITVPPGEVVAMGGTGAPPEPRGALVTWSYRSEAPVPFLNIAIAPYRVMDAPGSRIFHFAADTAGARMVQRAIADAMANYAAWFGPLAHGATLTVMEIPEGFGSQASLAAGILQSADAFQDRAELRQLYHELSHLWNVADADRPSPRWNEGLASFLQYRMAATLDGWNDWDGAVVRRTASLERACAPPARCDSVPMARYGAAGMTDLSYGTGMLMFYALFEVLGAERFDRAYGGFFQARQSTEGSTAELAAAFRAAGPASAAVIDDWLLTPRWYARLRSGESVAQMIAGYRTR